MSDVESSPILVHSCPPQIESWVATDSLPSIISPEFFLNPSGTENNSEVNSKNCTPNTSTYILSSDLFVNYDSEGSDLNDSTSKPVHQYGKVENLNKNIAYIKENTELTSDRSATNLNKTLNTAYTSKYFIEKEKINSLKPQKSIPLAKNTIKRSCNLPISLKNQPSKRKRNPWNKAELDALTQGMEKYGTSWVSILKDHGPNGLVDTRLANRSSVQLKDKARSEREFREKAGLKLGIFRISTTHN